MDAIHPRSISPVGTSKFERAYTPSTYVASPTSPTSAVSWQFAHGHQHKQSLSTWSSTSETGADSYSYSTPTSSIYHTPITPIVKTFADNVHVPVVERDDQSGYTADDDDDDEAAPRHPIEFQYQQHDHHDHLHYNDHPKYLQHTSSPIDPAMEADEWYARLEQDDQLADSYLGDPCPDMATLAAVQDIPIYDSDGNPHTFGSLHDPSTAVNQRQLIIFIRHFYCGACQAYVKAISESITIQDYFSIPIPTSIIIIGCGSPSLISFYRAITGTKFPVFAEPTRQLYKKLGMVLSANLGLHSPGYMGGTSTIPWLAGQITTIAEGLKARSEHRRLSSMASGFDLMQRRNTLVKPQPLHAIPIPASPRQSDGLPSDAQAGSMVRTAHSFDKDELDEDADELNGLQRLKTIARSKSIRRRDVVRGGNLFQIGGEFLFEDGQVIWCHRMRHYRNHVEVEDLRRLLDLDS